MEFKLYLALKSLMEPAYCDKGHSDQLAIEEQANQVIKEYEVNMGPLPDWASGHNFKREPLRYAQLITRNPHSRGNGIIASIEGDIYVCYTDMGNRMNLSLSELNSLYEIGPYISLVEGVDQRRMKDQLERL